MVGYIAGSIIAVIFLVVLYVRSLTTYYRRIFSVEHYTEVGNWLEVMLKRGPVDDENMAANALRSSAGCGLSYTRTVDERDVVHIAISQIGRPTTHAVCGRLSFLVLTMLKQNRADATLFYTQSGVHHLELSKDPGGDWIADDVGSAVSRMDSYEPPVFQLMPLPQG